MASAAGHDINYIAIAGALGAIGAPGERPLSPLNLVGDYGGGGMLLAFGVVCGAARGAQLGPGSGGRRRDGRRRRDADDDHPRPARRRDLERRARHQRARLRRPLLRGLRDRRRRSSRRRRDRAAVLRASCCGLLELDPAECPQWNSDRGRVQAAVRRAVRDEDPRRVGAAARGSRRVRDAGAAHGRGADAAAHCRAAEHSSSATACVQPAPAPRFSRTVPEIVDPPLPEDALRAWGVGR